MNFGRLHHELPALQPGGVFLFKLHAPRHFIVGGGVFSADDAAMLTGVGAFRSKWRSDLAEMRARIGHYRSADPGDRSDFPVAVVLTRSSLRETGFRPKELAHYADVQDVLD